MKKILIIITFLLLIIPINTKAISSDGVNLSIKRYYVDAEIEIAGSLRIKELLEINGSYNGYENILMYANSSSKLFTGTKDDLLGNSKIYDGTDVIIHRVGMFKGSADINSLSDDSFLENNLILFTEDNNARTGDKGKYSVSYVPNGKNLKLFNETINGTTRFFIEYTISNVLVEHNDCAELYYNYISNMDSIDDVKIITRLPFAPSEVFNVWGHGELTANIIKDETNGIVVTEAVSYPSNTALDNRIVFDKDLFMVNINENKKSNMDALPIILEIEKERADEANNERRMARIIAYGLAGIDSVYLVCLIIFFILVLKRHDIEYKSKFNHEYNREFIDEYDVEYISYIMDKKISHDAFSASIMNLIYKKKIEVKELPTKRKTKDYEFTKVNTENISKAESIIMELLFDKAGVKDKVTLSDFKILADKTTPAGANEVYDTFNAWVSIVKNEAEDKEFWEDKSSVKVKNTLFSALGLVLGSATMFNSFPILGVTLVLFSFVYLLYILLFQKRTVKGNEHYNKWKAFKNFLNDFGDFETKELPEITLWERYLVYAVVFGIAEKVSKDMEVKFESMPEGISTPILGNYLFYSYMSRNVSHSINRSLSSSASSVAIAKSSNSSGSGGGGGFSGGGGFGGGGRSGGGF